MLPRLSRHSLLIALAASLVLHLVLLLGPGWHSPSDVADLPIRLEGHFRMPTQAPAVKPPAKPVPKPRPPKVLPSPASPTAPQASLPPLAKAEPEPPTPVLPLPESAATPTAPEASNSPELAGAPGLPIEFLPLRGRLVYEVSRGEKKLVLGRTTHTWTREGNAYALNSVTETSGLAALLKRFKLSQTSIGSLTRRGLQPQTFVSSRDDEAPLARADFNWQSGKLTQTYEGQTKEVGLEAGAQDLLSLIYQLVLLAPEQQVQFTVATGKSYNLYTLQFVAEESIDTRFGTLRTRHFKTQGPVGERTTEVWLALEHDLLPVRVRFTEKDGEVWDMTATDVAFGKVLLNNLSVRLPGE